jgi:histidinol-phosphate aminotransferase
MSNLNVGQQREFLERGFSRRAFGRIATLIGAGAAGLPFYNEPAMAQLSMIGPVPPDAVMINSNENPMGPCPEALEVMYGVVRNGGRYMFEKSFELAETLAEIEGVPASHVRAFAGSSDPLHRSVLAFTSPSKSYVAADPGYEAGENAARFIGAKVIRVPLTKSHAHDVRAMASADPNAGLIYVCNPNNPTGTLTSRADIEWLLANKPSGSIVLLDEAYIHFSGAAPCCDLAATRKDIIVLRTFSKLYGMAGIRAGVAIGRPELIAKIAAYGNGMMPVAGMAGATASLKVKNLLAERRKLMASVRNETFEFLDKHKYSFIPSESNKFMLDVKRPGQQFARAMAAEKVLVGRVWPAWPEHVRVTIGTKDEMAKFRTALLKVMPA